MNARAPAWVAILLASACDGGVCSTESLRAALATAREGDVVLVGACEIEGAFAVPAGVTVRGGGPESVLASVGGGAPVLELAPGRGARVESLTIRVEHGGRGVRAVDALDIALSDVRVHVSRGIGVALGGASASLTRVDLQGPVTAENAIGVGTEPGETAVFGVLARASTLRLEAVHARGFAVSAVATEGGELDWIDTDGDVDVEATLGNAVAVYGTQARLTGLSIRGLLAGPGRPGIAVLAAPDGLGAPAGLTATELSVTSGAGYGLVAEAGDVALQSVVIEGLGLVGIHAQGGVSLRATDLTVRDNGGAGLVAIDAREVLLQRADLSAQRTASLPTAEGSVRAADGIQVRRTSASAPSIELRAEGVTLFENGRVGLLIDGADEPAQLELRDVRVQAGSDGALGAIAQRVVVPPEWDDDVAREGVTLANDAAFVGTIDPAGLLMPPALVARPPMP